MAVIFTASTSLMSADHTSRFIAPVLRWLVSEISAEAILAVQFFLRKTAHLLEYAILAGLLWRALRPAEGCVSVAPFAKAFFIAAAYAGLDEFHQSFRAARSGAFGDVLIDICGAAIGLAACWLIARRSPAAIAQTVVAPDRT